MQNVQRKENSYHFMEQEAIKRLVLQFQYDESYYCVITTEKQSVIISEKY